MRETLGSVLRGETEGWQGAPRPLLRPLSERDFLHSHSGKSHSSLPDRNFVGSVLLSRANQAIATVSGGIGNHGSG